jgi:beta-lactamase superfamily II metal-dependent hydrolase
MQKGDIVYYAKTRGSVKPVGPAHHFKKSKSRVALLWGDPMYVIRVRSGKATVSSKGHHLEIPTSHLMTTPLLSIYQIDCGQGDAALVHFPDDRWMMVDGGPSAAMTNSGKIASNFLQWKIFVDQSWRSEFKLGGPFRIDAMVCTHPDADHFGGFVDMVDWVKPRKFEIGTVFHNGLARFSGPYAAYRSGKGFSQLGPVAGRQMPDGFLTTLIDRFDDVRRYSRATRSRQWVLKGAYADWLRSLAEKEGQGIRKLQRIDHGSGYLPGFRPRPGAPSVRVLGPVAEAWTGKPALRFLDRASVSAMKQPSLTRNGHSVVLRIDHGEARILLTGDLNFRSQALLLKHVPPEEFRCHVGKACHHGSEDVSSTFLKAMSPLATMFSSGDNERYAHPRAKILGLSGAFGELRATGRKKSYLGLTEENYIAPLLYSTELSRSVQLWDLHSVYDKNGERIPAPGIQARGRTKSTRNRGPRRGTGDWLLADKMVYGLINVRTDGQRIVLGVLKEDESGFQTEEFDVRGQAP